jgi:hypothetical protein
VSGQNCPECGTWIQRAPDGTVADGMRIHYLVVHPEVPRG